MTIAYSFIYVESLFNYLYVIYLKLFKYYILFDSTIYPSLYISIF